MIENTTYKQTLQYLIKSLQEQDMQCQILRSKDRKNADKEGVETFPCLWITDEADWARELCKDKHPVLAFLHDHNRHQDFSRILYAFEDLQSLDVVYLDRVYRRYKQLPWEILQTDRCIIRETVPEDVDAFYEIYKEPSITQYMEGLFEEREQEVQYLEDYRDKIYNFYGFGIWTILKKDTGEIIGRAGLSYREGYDDPELGFVIGCPWQRQGYAKEVCKAILEYGRNELGFTRIQAFVRSENKASLAVCRALDMHPVEEIQMGEDIYLCVKIK